MKIKLAISYMLRYYRFILLWLFIGLPQIAGAQWKKFQLLDETVIYKSIHVAADTFYVSGGKGLYGTFDAGTTWSKYDLGGYTMLNDLDFFNSKVGVGVGSIGGNSATAMKTFDGGKSWTITYVSNAGTVIREINDVEFIDKLTGYAVGSNKIVIKTTDGGTTWTSLNPIVEKNNTGIKMKAVNQGYIVSPSFIQGFNGQSITGTKLVGSKLVDLKIIDDKNLIAASNTKISKSSDGGATWTHFAFPYSQINAMFVLNQQNIYVGTNNGVYISTDGGVSWENFKETTGKVITTISINPDGQGIALGKYGDAFKTDNFGGASVPILSFDFTEKQYCNVSSLIFAATNTRANYSYQWLLKDQLVSTNALDSVRFTTNTSSTLSLVCSNGVASDTLTKSFYVGIIEVQANAGKDVYACSNEPIPLAASGGAWGGNFTWTPNTGLSNPKIQTPVATNLNTIKYVVSASHGSCVSRDTVVVFRNPPVSRFDFRKMNIDTSGWISGIQMADENTGYALGEQDLYKTTDGGINWSKTFHMATFSTGSYGDVEFLSKDVGYFGSVYLYKTTDGGKTAEQVGGGGIHDIEFLSADVGYITSFSFTGEFGSILRTVDGKTWTEVYSQRGQILKIKCFPSGRCVAIGHNNYNVIFLYSDNGINWQNADYPDAISAQQHNTDKFDISFIDDTTGYSVVGAYIWKTMDGGKSWNLDSQLNVASALDDRVVGLATSQITFIDNQNGFATCWGSGLLFRTVNGGGCWENLGQIGDASMINKLYISKNKKIFIGANGPSFASQSIYQADFLLPLKRDQTIEFSIQTPKTLLDAPFKLGAVASSTLPIAYEASDNSIASISGDVLTLKNPGVVQITARQVGNDSFNPALPVSRSLTIIKVPQNINFTLASQKLVTDPPFDLVGSSSSGLPLAYFTSDESVISISGNRATIKKAGTVQITAKQGGDGIFNVATPVVQNLEVKRVPQDISFTLASQKLVTDPPFNLVGSSSSGLPLAYFTSDESVISIGGNRAIIKKAGNVQITAKQGGDDIFDVATPVVQNLEVKKVQQSIIFDLPSKKYGDPDFALDARSDAGIPITYSIDNYSVVDLINGNMIRIKSVGNTNITATAQSTSIYYEASATKNLEISTITGIEESTLNKSIIYPNPADRVIVINLAEFTNSPVTISVYDMYGRDLSMITTTATKKIPLDISNFQPGIYFVKIIHKNETNILKFIKR